MTFSWRIEGFNNIYTCNIFYARRVKQAPFFIAAMINNTLVYNNLSTSSKELKLFVQAFKHSHNVKLLIASCKKKSNEKHHIAEDE